MRLTDGDTLWEKLDDEPWYDNADRDEIALPIVAAATSVDAVEVVRCKDCKYSCKDGNGRSCEGYWYELSEYDVTVKDDDFCSYGEGKDYD